MAYFLINSLLNLLAQDVTRISVYACLVVLKAMGAMYLRNMHRFARPFMVQLSHATYAAALSAFVDLLHFCTTVHRHYEGGEASPILLWLILAGTLLEYLALMCIVEHLCGTHYRLSPFVTIMMYGVIAPLLCIIILPNNILSYVPALAHLATLSRVHRAVFWTSLILKMYGITRIIRTYRNTATPPIVRKILLSACMSTVAAAVTTLGCAFNPYAIAPLWHNSTTPWDVTAYIGMMIVYLLTVRPLTRWRLFANPEQQETESTIIDHHTYYDALGFLARARTIRDVRKATADFLRQTFHIPGNRTVLNVRFGEMPNQEPPDTDAAQRILRIRVEEFFETHDPGAIPSFEDDSYITTHLIVLDEMEFVHFYLKSEECAKIVAFMRSINADIIIPIRAATDMTGSLVINSNARPERFYSHSEIESMISFGAQLSTVLAGIQLQGHERYLAERKHAVDMLCLQHFELACLKESIRTCMGRRIDRFAGLITYKNRKFSYANHTAHELLGIDPEKDLGHPISSELRNLVAIVRQYRSHHMRIVLNDLGERIVLSAVFGEAQDAVYILVYHPDTSDLVRINERNLYDPADWHYVLYLEATRMGQLASSQFPGNTATVLNFKVNLMRAALSKKVTLLRVPSHDTMAAVELIHHISGRQVLHVLSVPHHDRGYFTVEQLFGPTVPRIPTSQTHEPLLRKLDGIGTLLIENVHHLSGEAQNRLATLITTGAYPINGQTEHIETNVRIICATGADLALLVSAGNFSRELYNALMPNTLELPPIASLGREELMELIDNIVEHMVNDHSVRDVFTLTPIEREHIMAHVPASMHELKTLIRYTLATKAQKKPSLPPPVEQGFEPAIATGDPRVARAVRMGKRALRDKTIMTFLWQTYKSQAAIASLLKVNRSSVSRRCHEFGLVDPAQPTA